MRSLIAIAVFALPAIAQDDTPKLDPVKWSLSAPAESKAGARFLAKLTARVEEGWHLYSLKPLEGGPIPTQVAIPAPQPFKLVGQIDAPVPLTAHEEAFGMSVEFYFGEVEFVLPVEVHREAKPGQPKLAVTARYQACDNTQCLPPKAVRLESVVSIR